MIRTLDNCSLAPHNTFAMNVRCGEFMEYTAAADIPFILSSIRRDVEIFHIGAGSNLLFTRDFPGIILHSAIKGIEIISENAEEIIVRAGAGETMDDLISWSCERGLWGLENLSGIPGEVGASAVQNVGAYGREAGDVITTVHAYDEVEAEFVTFAAKDCSYAYRDSLFKHPDSRKRYIIHAVDYRLSPLPRPELSYPALAKHFEGRNADSLTPGEIRNAVIAIRDSKLPDPSKVASAGSFFKNPVITRSHFEEISSAEVPDAVPHYKVNGDCYKIPAAWLIDRCGWKGYRDGNVAVWHLQPLVIVNPERKATPDEVISLERRIIDSVEKRFAIKLTPEVEHI